jgi:hypothetical protein
LDEECAKGMANAMDGGRGLRGDGQLFPDAGLRERGRSPQQGGEPAPADGDGPPLGGRKLQNISAALGAQWISGYEPLAHYQDALVVAVERSLGRAWLSVSGKRG